VHDFKIAGAGGNASDNFSIKIRTYAYDLSLKFSTPIANKVKLFGKAGIAYLDTLAMPNGDENDGNDQHGYLWRPVAAVGTTFEISEHCDIDLSVSVTPDSGIAFTVPDYAPYLYFVSAGFNYKFG